MKNPYVFWTVAALALIAGFFLGKSEWFNNLFVSNKQSIPRPISEGKPCTTVGGKPGVFKGGVCTDSGGILVDQNASNKTNYTATNSEENNSNNANTATSSSERISNTENLSEQQRGIFNTIKNNTTERFPAACKTWVDMVIGGASSSAVQAQWKVCSAAWGRTTQGSNPNAPNELFLPINTDCQKYTTTNPYVYLGCSYVFEGIVLEKGRRMCKMKRVSCP